MLELNRFSSRVERRTILPKKQHFLQSRRRNPIPPSLVLLLNLLPEGVRVHPVKTNTATCVHRGLSFLLLLVVNFDTKAQPSNPTSTRIYAAAHQYRSVVYWYCGARTMLYLFSSLEMCFSSLFCDHLLDIREMRKCEETVSFSTIITHSIKNTLRLIDVGGYAPKSR